MSELRELYQELILDHKRHPRNFRVIENASRVREGHNPLCGDHLWLYLRLSQEGIVEDVSFQGEGCAIATASASLLTEAVRGMRVEEALALAQSVAEVLTGASSDPQEIGKLAVLAGVRDYPVRVKCAMLAWRTLQAALGEESQAAVSTE